MVKKQQIDERRRRNRELGARDAANRCAHCRRELGSTFVRTLFSLARFCSDDCAEAAIEVARMKAGR